MERGLYIAASGMIADMVRQDQIANDLSNASTPGYKADKATQRSFGDLLLSNTVTGQTIGPLGMGAHIDKIYTDTTPAPLRQTGNPLDFAVEGDGWFAVQTAQGIRYTRNGQFQASQQGDLIDGMGNRVLSQGGAPIRVPTNGQLNPQQLGVFAVTNVQKIGDNYVTGTAGGRATGTVTSGALEGSNADPAHSMVDMIASFRSFEAGQHAIHTIDETLQKAANQVGGISG